MAELQPRAFGRAREDLDLDFAQADRPALVTALLAACAAGGDAHWWRQPVGARTAALLGLLQASEGRDALALTLRCAACGEPFEVELPHAALVRLPAAADVELARAGDEPLRLRLPTGEDLRAWGVQPPGLREQMLARLCTAGTPRPGDEAAAAEALAQADPLVAFSVECRCPACDAAAAPEVDLEGLALQRLAARQRTLLLQVHALASRYGWTEEQILAVPPARRAQYLELIEGWA